MPTFSQQRTETRIGDTDLEPLVDEREFARLTKRSLASIRRDRLLRRGCPYVKLIGSIRYRREDIQRWVTENLHASPSK